MRAEALIYRPAPGVPSDGLCKRRQRLTRSLKSSGALQGWGRRPGRSFPLSRPRGARIPRAGGTGTGRERWSARGAALGQEHAGRDSLGEACPTAPSAVPILCRNPQCQRRKLDEARRLWARPAGSTGLGKRRSRWWWGRKHRHAREMHGMDLCVSHLENLFGSAPASASLVLPEQGNKASPWHHHLALGHLFRSRSHLRIWMGVRISPRGRCRKLPWQGSSRVPH